MGTSLPQINHFLVTFLIFVVTGLCICSGSNSTGICKEEEKQALLCFKEESKILRNWVDRADCCTEWEGVVCDNVTGHVTELHLLTNDNLLRGKLSSCLLEVKQLRYLDLSGLNFSESHIPNFIGSFVNLQYIDLSSTRFEGIIPHQLGNLSHLHTLRLGADNALKADNLDWLSNLSNLKVLDLSYVNLSMVHNWAEVINMLPSLRELYLNDCDISKSSHPLGHNKSSLQVLELAYNKFNSVIFRWIFNLDSLRTLDISANQFHGHLPNSLLNLTSLRTLQIFENQFHGHLPNSLWNLTSFSDLDLSENMFTGEIPKPIGKLNKLQSVYLYNNKLYGPLPENLGYSFPMLENLNIMGNMLEGIVTENHFVNLAMLRYLQASGNRLTLNVSLNWIPPFQLFVLYLSGWKLGPQFPTWLQYQHTIVELDISNAGIQSEVPNLSNNNLSGVIPWCLKNLTAMINEEAIQDGEFEMGYSSYDGAYGESAIVTTKWLEYEYYTIILLLFVGMDLSSNNFSGDIPIELANLVRLRSLNLSRNNLTGNIPMEMGNMRFLESLDLSRNQLSGKIPPSFSSLNTLEVLDESYNNLSGKIPSGTQLQGFNASCYIGNNLCGPPLLQSCSVDDGKIPKNENKGDDSSEVVDWFYVSMAIGFAVSFWAFCGSLLLVRPWRIVYFQFLDDKLKSFLVWAHALRV
ncbi:PREDICTED: probable leucine-rich repeat receptor-like protein kinase At1g35710 [Ipomoea nil]|uniref:probable leucine-rich repeat receptor-like protein kinase At1g35710 n=1 Tax=Ipomoea nil TaxID=35883 RepID=UPI000901302E|nr:PREDICTED: probable leucine-rich repeat receptor-like protein kinase At1g35710 [Ipomoea nil]